MVSMRSSTDLNTPRQMVCRLRFEKKLSTALSYEHGVSVKWNVHLG